MVSSPLDTGVWGGERGVKSWDYVIQWLLVLDWIGLVGLYQTIIPTPY